MEECQMEIDYFYASDSAKNGSVSVHIPRLF